MKLTNYLFGALQPFFLLVVFILLSSYVGAAPKFDYVMNLAEQKFGEQGRQGISSWREMLKKAGERNEIGRIQAVNDFFNQRILFVEDVVTWNLHDYWATPWRPWAEVRVTAKTSA